MSDELMVGLVLVVLVVVVSSLGWVFGDKNGYRQGQIDCINGKIKYELCITEDKEKVWCYNDQKQSRNTAK